MARLPELEGESSSQEDSILPGLDREDGGLYSEEKGPVMDIQEQKQFREWLKTLCPSAREMALLMKREGKPLEEIRYYVEF